MHQSDAPPQIVLIGAIWPIRALVRAQLIEDGYEVVATDGWPMPRPFLRAGRRPRLVIVDLQGLPDAERVLSELRALMEPDRVLIVTALGTSPPDEIRRAGFRVISRPLSVEDIVRAAADALK